MPIAEKTLDLKVARLTDPSRPDTIEEWCEATSVADLRCLAELYLRERRSNRERNATHSIERAAPVATYYTKEAADEKRKERERRASINARIDAEVQSEFRSALTSAIADHSRRLQAQWTEELLGRTFALPGGGVVLWGEATAAQHDARAGMLEALAVGNAESASLHRRAILDIEAGSVSSLGEL